MVEAIPLSEATTERCGPKAAALGQMLRAGLPVPSGVVFVGESTAANGAADTDALPRAALEKVAPLTAPLVVRSSANLEDRAQVAGPGVFVSLRDVGVADLLAAILRVRASAHSPAARTYRSLHGDDDDLAMAVIVQSQCQGVRGTIYTRPPGQPASTLALIQRTDRQPHIEPLVEFERTTASASRDLDGVPAERLASLVALAERAAVAIGAEAGADVEWVYDGDSFWLVQARPVGGGVIDTRTPLPRALLRFSESAPTRVWHWDARHNPLPLSPAQTGLVERVEAGRVGRYEQKVIGGYLYYADRVDDDGRAALPADVAPWLVSADRFAARLGEISSQMEAHFADEPPTPVSVATALERYLRFYRCYSDDLAPLLGAGRRALIDVLAAFGADTVAARRDAQALLDHYPPRPGKLHHDASAAARQDAAATKADWPYADRMAPSWDVAAKTFGEMRDPGGARHDSPGPMAVRVDIDPAGRTAPATTSDERVRSLLDRTEVSTALEITRAALTASEDDDLWFGRAQYEVRRALLHLGHQLELPRADDIFWIPLAEAIVLESIRAATEDKRASTVIATTRAAAASRAAHRRAAQWRPPLAFANGRPCAAEADGNASTWFGCGSGGVARGRTVRWQAPDALPPLGESDVLVIEAITPQLAIIVRQCAAIVTAYGGPLDHAMALARELGIPCVSGVPTAVTSLASGEWVVVDGSRGLVMRQLA